ncbi:MAG: peptidylprolyl isomerase [Acidobacteria bacterium]|nr:peptidylprolyl isomerase [Acidobacteriota bacterium]
MKFTRILIVLALALIAGSCSKSGGSIAVIDTDFGQIKLKLDAETAPKHVENFTKLAREGFYNGLAFHRAVPGLLIQGGDPNTRTDDRNTWGIGQPGQPRVQAEFSQKPFVRGTLGAARTNDPNSATSQFFICLRPNPGWNGQYTVFGEVIEGIEVVDKIASQPTDPRQNLLNKAVMRKVTIQD